MSANSDDTPKRMGKSKKGDRLDAVRFQSPGINYRGKFIGVEDVSGPRGDKMCQVAMAKVKAAVKTIGEHKLKIIVNISLDGVRIVEEKSESILYFHPVQRISFISRDPGDSRAFGYIYGREDGSHQFYGIKTEKVAENIVLNLRDLFQIVFEMKKQEKEELQDSFVHESQPSSTVKKVQSTRNGLEQLNVYTSSVAMLSSSYKASSKLDSSGNQTLFSSAQSPVSHDGNHEGPSQSGFKHSKFATRQYSSMSSSDRHQLQPPSLGSSTLTRQQSASEANATRISPLAKLQAQHSSVASSGWFPVAIPPPEDSYSSLGRRTAVHPPSVLEAAPADPSAAEGWAVFETGKQNSSAVAGCGKLDGLAVQENVGEDTRVQTSELLLRNQRSDEAYVDSDAEKRVADSDVAHAVGLKKRLFSKLSNVTGSGSREASESPVDVVNCTFYSHVECSGSSPKSSSGVPKLASPESLGDDEEEEEEEEENSSGAASFPSPDAPPPPLPLDRVVDYTLQPPALPPRLAVFEFSVSRSNADPAESPIYGNLPTTDSTAKSSFTLPRPRPMQPNGDLTSPRVRPIQAGYDLTMPRPRPAPNSTNLRPHDALELNESGTFACPRFLLGTSLSACQNKEPNEIIFESSFSAVSQSLNNVESAKPGSINNRTVNDPFAIFLLSKNTKPQTVLSLSSAANDGFIHTSVSPIPRPRPRQRSVPGATRDGSTSVASSSESPMKNSVIAASPLQTSVVDVNQRNTKQLNCCRSESSRSEHSPNSLSLGRQNAESLSDKVARVPSRVREGRSAGSSRSDVGPDPFVQIDPFAAESFSGDPFSSQPDPLSLESPSSDPFSNEFTKKGSWFYTRAVTVEMGDVFDDMASASRDAASASCDVASGSRDVASWSRDVASTSSEPDKKTSAESRTIQHSVHVSASESAMAQKAVIFLEKAIGDSAAVTVGRSNLHSSDDGKSQDEAKICEGNGNNMMGHGQNGAPLQRNSASGRRAVPTIAPEILCGNFLGERVLMGGNVRLVKSNSHEFEPNICDSALQTDVTEGFSDSFDRFPFCLDSDPDKTIPSQVNH